MIREGLRRLVRAACAALDEDTVVIIGSQSILGSFGDFMLPAAATVSVEADLLPFDDLDESKADRIDGLLGADSYFAATYGIYADGVSAWTAQPARGKLQRMAEAARLCGRVQPDLTVCLQDRRTCAPHP